ncbi:MAG: B12-binding domain-containing radical SAM protein [Deltaproteobacteria bacterium]|nr:B12-binding domain-containing radical SAM protein [Deltaproteobacteria bacterium]
MKVLFIYPDVIGWGGSWYGFYYLGISHIISAVEAAGHDASLFHAFQPPKKRSLFDAIDRISPDIIGFSSTTNMFPYVREWVAWIREEFSTPIVCGGIHPTIMPKEVIGVEGIDYVVIGEGEAPMVELCDAIEKGGETLTIKNIWARQGSEISKNPLRPLVSNLDVLPYPDRTKFNYMKIGPGRHNAGIFSASRGCPYNCYYCCNHTLKHIYGEKQYVRFRSPENVITEIEQVCRSFSSIDKILFDDDILPLKKEWFREFINLYKDRINLPFTCNSRVELIDDETAHLLEEGGCIKVQFGVESGNPRIRSEMLGRHHSNDTIIKASERLRDAGIQVHSFNIVGLPGERVKDVLDTIKLNSLIMPSSVQVSILYPYPKTELYDITRKMNLLKPEAGTTYFKKSCLKLPGLSGGRLNFLVRYFKTLYKLYRLCPPGSTREDLLDRLITNRLTGVTLMPLLSAFKGTTKWMELSIRGLKRRIKSLNSKQEYLS